MGTVDRLKLYVRFAISTGVILLYGMSVVAMEKSVDIQPVYQEKTAWCWLAVGQMVFKYFREPNVNPNGDYQCGIIGLYYPQCSQDCASCNVGSGTTDNLIHMLREYPVAAAKFLHIPARQPLTLSRHNSALSFADLKAELDQDRPVVAGINLTHDLPPGESEHVTVISGYDESSSTITVNDPFPYASLGMAPYDHAGGHGTTKGRYEIAYSAFVNNLHWVISIDHIVDPNSQSSGKKIKSTDEGPSTLSAAAFAMIAASDKKFKGFVKLVDGENQGTITISYKGHIIPCQAESLQDPASCDYQMSINKEQAEAEEDFNDIVLEISPLVEGWKVSKLTLDPANGGFVNLWRAIKTETGQQVVVYTKYFENLGFVTKLSFVSKD